jgi:hypothetical protein
MEGTLVTRPEARAKDSPPKYHPKRGTLAMTDLQHERGEEAKMDSDRLNRWTTDEIAQHHCFACNPFCLFQESRRPNDNGS